MNKNNGYPMNRQVYFFIAELVAVAVLRAIIVLKRDNILPKGGKVQRVKGKPVYRFPLIKRWVGSSTAEPRTVIPEDEGSNPSPPSRPVVAGVPWVAPARKED